jgi:hypothetical protein
MTKLMIVTPAYDGKLNAQYCVALMQTAVTLKENHIPFEININTSGSLLVAERNKLTETFMRSDCTHMLCIDADLGWPPAALIAMILADKEFVAGVYPSRGDKVFTFRPKLNENKSIVQIGNLLGMEYIPAGFMLIKRSVIEKMREKFPELYYEPIAEQMKFAKGFCFFDTEVWNGEFWGEDYVFCRRAREAGVDIWVDPMIEFDHAGQRGALMAVLSNKPPEENKDAVV